MKLSKLLLRIFRYNCKIDIAYAIKKHKIISSILVCIVLFAPAPCKAETVVTNEMVTDEIREGVESAIENSDLSSWDSIFYNLPEDIRSLWGGMSLNELVGQYALGEGEYLGLSLQNGIASLFKSLLPELIPTLVSVLAVAIITGFLKILNDAGMKGLNDIAGFVCQCFAIGIALSLFLSLALLAKECIEQTTGFIELAFPVLMTLLIAAGGITSSGIFQPAMAMLCSGVSVTLQGVVLPIILTGGVLGVLNNITGRVQLEQFFKLSKSAAKWIIGFIFTLYFAITSLQGLSAAAFDGISMRTAKFAMDKFIPIVGGMVSGTIDTVMGCAILVKNAAGIAAIVIAFSIVIIPLLKIVAGMLAFRLAAALCEPISDSRLTGMLSSLADILSYLFAAACSLAIMFMITAGLIVGVSTAGFS